MHKTATAKYECVKASGARGFQVIKDEEDRPPIFILISSKSLEQADPWKVRVDMQHMLQTCHIYPTFFFDQTEGCE